MVIIIALSEITRAFPMLSSSFPPIAPDLRKLADTHTFHGTRLWRERLVVISLNSTTQVYVEFIYRKLKCCRKCNVLQHVKFVTLTRGLLLIIPSGLNKE